MDENGLPIANMEFEYLMTGGVNTGVSYDNITVDYDGNVLIQEDRTAGGGDVMDSQMRNKQVISYNIVQNKNRLGNDEITKLFEIDQDVEGSEFNNGFGSKSNIY